MAFTCSLGAFIAQKIFISEPEIQHRELEHDDQFIVIGSDGIWDVMNSDEVCNFVKQTENKEEAA